jgi:hypothetical protein
LSGISGRGCGTPLLAVSLQNRKADFCVPPGEKVPANAIKGLALHNVHEFANYKVLIPEIYKELGGRVFED